MSARPSSPPRRHTADVYGWVFQKALFGTWERYVKRRPIPAYLEQLEKSQWLPASDIERLQTGYLRDLLTHAQANVPYYRELFAKIGFDARDLERREDLSAIPVLTKDIIRERYDDLVDPSHRGLNVVKGTSGSTGIPLKFEHCMDSSAWREATRMRGYRWGGYRLGGPTFHYWAQAAPLVGFKGAKIRLDRATKRDVMVDSMHSDEKSMLEAVDTLRKTRPTCLVVFTQSAALWARFILDRGLRDWADIPVLCGAEAVLPSDREVLGRAFGPVFETYGSREVMLMASECSAHDGMHLSEENLLLEIARDGKPLGPNESGDVLVTDLHNYGFPFIRYVNGDVATMGDATPCACGRGLRRLKSVEGRRADTLLDKEGKPIPGILFHVFLADARQEVVTQFQAIQKKDGAVTLKIVRGKKFTPEAFAVLEERVRGYLRGQPMSVEFCDDIPPQANGKRKTIFVEK